MKMIHEYNETIDRNDINIIVTKQQIDGNTIIELITDPNCNELYSIFESLKMDKKYWDKIYQKLKNMQYRTVLSPINKQETQNSPELINDNDVKSEEKIIETVENEFNDEQINLDELPKRLVQCSINDMVIISLFVAKQINDNALNPFNTSKIKHLFMEEKLNGNIISNINQKEFINKAKKYGLPAPKASKLLINIKQHFKDDLIETNNIDQEENDVNISEYSD